MAIFQKTSQAEEDLIEKPKLPANATIEAIFLVEKEASPSKKSRQLPLSIAGKGKIIGDIVSPVVSPEEWYCLK